ncbi:hypothetical protein MAPG_01628 [Magnaporthiopsis poae ATCC 64411]|uniref:Heterokaryon incompatibility domain-containing protein n=1 Tax=Magnaporthiopsis poae (strain ATCC 64411 / 73-15) TaxID=644358 RepID=A0A0C4DP74_MAGP6|nr:hypothetical protein MAPG_01628 [Magnaporthiopsis poae ATCC 64411]
MVCDVCFDLRPEKAEAAKSWEPPRWARLKISFAALLKSKGRGCQICYAIFRGLEIFTESVRVGLPMNTFLRNLNPDRSHLFMTMVDGGPLELAALIRLPSMMRDWTKKRRSRFTGIGPGRKVAPKPSTDRRVKLIKEWTKDCQENHAFCREWRASSDGPGPRRMLDLSGNPRSRVRLVDPFDRAADGDYATFIHPCPSRHADGGADAAVYRLTTSNYASLKRGIRWADLPAAFKDAVAVASEQGLRYLWIDALCVIQDDDEDFHWHIENLGEIYRASIFTISPTRLRDAGATFLGPRRLVPTPWATTMADEIGVGDESMRTHEVVLSRGKHKFSVYIRRRLCASHHHLCSDKVGRCGHTLINLYWNFPTPPWMPQLGPMLSSAWSFMQRLTSTRTVHFHGSEMVWECQTGFKCECSISIKNSLPDPHTPSPLATVPSKQSPDDDPFAASFYSNRWGALIRLYTRLSMPENQHRLHALAGYMSVYGKNQAGYYAGLIANTPEELAKSLLWWVNKVDEGLARKSYRFDCRSAVPSWSWASVGTEPADSVVLLDYTLGRRRKMFVSDAGFEVEAIDHRSLAGSTEYGALSGDSWGISLRGRMMLAKISPRFRWHKGQPFVPSSSPLMDFFSPFSGGPTATACNDTRDWDSSPAPAAPGYPGRLASRAAKRPLGPVQAATKLVP